MVRKLRRKIFPLQNPKWEKTKLTIRYYTKRIYRQPWAQLFPNRWSLSYPDEYIQTYLGANSTNIQHRNIRKLEPQWQYRLGKKVCRHLD